VLRSPNTQLHYPFQNTAKDYSGNARDGTVKGSGVYATKPGGGRCLYFDGVGDYVKTPSFGLSGTVVVFAADVRCKLNASVHQCLLGDYGYSSTIGYFFCARFAGSNALSWQYACTAYEAQIDCPNFFAAPYDDVWLHMIIACDYSGKKCYFYRNGTLFATINLVQTPVFPSTNRVKYLGIYNAFDYLFTAGDLANVQLWTLLTMPPAAQMLANAKRMMLDMHPIW